MAEYEQDDPFKAMGGGVRVNGGWVPKDHPSAKAAGAQPGGGGHITQPTGQPAATNVGDQAQRAATYSATPGAAPAKHASNQGTQDVVRNSYLAQATQAKTVGADDPNVRTVADANAAAIDRNRRQYLDEAAEKAGPYGTGAMAHERRSTAEQAGVAKGSFEAQLVQRQNDIRRAEIQQALGALAGMGDTDMKMQLQRELAELDAQNARLGIETQRYGIDVGARTAADEMGLKERLARQGYDIDWARLHQQDRHFGSELGFNIADREAYWNNQALQSLF